MFSLVPTSDPNHHISLPSGRFLIGRAQHCNLRPKSDRVSREHCELVVDHASKTVTIRDLGSRNGTLVNGGKIGATAVTLKNGDTIGILALVLNFVQIDEDTVQPLDSKTQAL